MCFFRLFSMSLRTRAVKAKFYCRGRPSGHWSKSGRYPSSIERVSFFFFAGVDKSFSLGFCVRPNSFSCVRTTVKKMCYLFCSEHSPRAQITDNSSSMQRACLPPADYKTTALPPRSCSRQHHARLAGPRCVCVVAFIGWSDRSPDHVIVSYENKTAQSLYIDNS